MSLLNQQNLSLKRTIETTFDRAKGWLLAQYPSSVCPNKKVTIDIRYPGEEIPSSQCEIFSSPRLKKIALDQKPVYLSLKRGGNEIALKRNVFTDIHGRKTTSYILAIHSSSGIEYRVIETHDGTIKGQGNPLLLLAVQQDKAFGQYISFALKSNLGNTLPDSQKWNLNQVMQKSRS